jgi:poly(hydroxyalkanoate) depolymerase family esterase
MTRQMGAMTRTALRAGAKLAKAAKPKPSRTPKARKSAAPKPTGLRAGMALGPAGAKRYYLYRPPGKAPAGKMALVVMLHGCGQDAHSFAASTRMNRLAAAAGMVVLYPEQDRLANVQACWNWFDTRSGRAQREAAGILAVVDQVCAAYPIDTQRIVVAGMSAGAGMAGLLALMHPERFAAVAMHSGVGPGLASSSATALAAMRGRSNSVGKALPTAAATPLPALLVIQGNKDTVVAPVNGGLAAARWAATVSARPAAPRVVKRGTRYPATLTEWKLGRRVVATWAQVAGLGHAWSGGAAAQPYSDPAGPDASRMVIAFAQRAFVQRLSAAVAAPGV